MSIHSQLELRDYVVVMRGTAGFHFGGLTGAFIVNQFPTSCGQIDLLFASHYARVIGFEQPVLRGVRVEIRGRAKSLKEAASVFSNAAGSILPVLTFCTNIECRDFDFEIVYEATPERTEREFFQQHLPESPWAIHEGRQVPINEVAAFMHAVATHSEQERLNRAMAHYHQALQHWSPGNEILALSNLYMAVEALTPVALRHELLALGIDKPDLAKLWDIDWNDSKQRGKFDSIVRLRLIFNADKETYEAAKAARDGYFHSFRSLPEIYTAATASRNMTATYVREAILRLSNAGEDCRGILLSDPYRNPEYWSFARYVFGTISGAGEELAAPDQQYPILVWNIKAVEANDPSHVYNVRFEETVSPKLAEGLTFENGRFEAWGPSRPIATSLDDPSSLTESQSGL